MEVSRRSRSVKGSSTLAVTAKAKELARGGVRVLSFAAGEPDFDTPEVVKRAAIEALGRGHTKYVPTAGDPETRAVIADKLTRENGLSGVSADHVVVTAGAKHALYLAFQALVDPPAHGAEAPEVLLPVPAWVSYDPIARLCGGRVVELETTAAGGFKVTPRQLERALTPRARVLILNSPNNPCGTMYTPEELRGLAGVVASAARSICPGLVIVTDEIYEKIVYGPCPHFSIGSVPEVAERTITINGLSKAFAMTGWRVGYLAGSGEFGRRVAQAAEKLQGQMTTSIVSFVFPAIRAALTECAGEVEQMRGAFARRARLIAERLERVPGLVCPRPTGAFYLFPDVSAYLGRTTGGGRRVATAAEMAGALLEEEHVAVVPGEDFGGPGWRHIRLSFACSEETIDEGMERVVRFFARLR
ncbi:MAG TPA: pyridoxal phosphate-dependent aminotransferase [Phycisphaerales bacterium]|nr:pyridoxal phosphate-dependent aminotransferase [Phycisphaerales bacterium]